MIVTATARRVRRCVAAKGMAATLMRVGLAIAAVAVAVGASAGEAPLVGRASVIDGDTIEIHGTRIRFNGIDAPESRQQCHDKAVKPYRCGKASADALDGFLAGSRPTSCIAVDRDRYGRVVADCFRADRQNAAAWLVRNGHALDWPKYSKGRYAADQLTAKEAHAGVWQGEFIEPWEHRRRKRPRSE